MHYGLHGHLTNRRFCSLTFATPQASNFFRAASRARDTGWRSTSRALRGYLSGMNTVNRSLSKLLPADYNPREELQPGDPEFEQLRDAIEQIGFAVPLVVNKATGRVVGGHQRLNVLAQLGYKSAPVVEIDLDETSEKALNVALNKIEGRWDESKLSDLLLGLEQSEGGVHLAGFTDVQLDELLRRVDQQQSTSFLDDLVQGSLTDPDRPKEDDDRDQEQLWTAVTYPLRQEERREVRRILDAATEHYAVSTSGLALAAVCNDYLESADA